MQTRLIFYSAFAVMLAVSGCKETEDEPIPSPIPSMPTTFSIEDGAEIKGLTVTLSVNGSTVEDKSLNVSYVYFIGKSADALEETTADVTLEPYTQYFWRAQAKTEVGESEMSEIHTFYCVPDLELSSDNGNGEWAAIIRWNNADKFKSVTISATPDHEGYSLESQTIESGIDSCYFKTTKPENDAYTHWWDDAKGVYYEPIIYTFNVVVKAQVGDKTFTFTSSVKEILLDKELVVRDHEYNVYRVTQIGNRKWLEDDLRAKSVVIDEDTIELSNIYIEFINSTVKDYITPKTDTLKESGSVGFIYCVGDTKTRKVHYESTKTGERKEIRLTKLIKLLSPKGFHISNNSDWEDLEIYYGVNSPEIMVANGGYVPDALPSNSGLDWKKKVYVPYFQGGDVDLRARLSSMYDWSFIDENESPINYKTQFNAKPFGYNGFGCIYYTIPDDDHNYGVGLFRVLATYDKGILNYGWELTSIRDYVYALLRCVKD